MGAIKMFRGGGGGSGRRKTSGSGCGAVFKILVGCSMILLFLGPRTTSAFFIDLDALGFSMSKSDNEGGGDVARDDSSLSASDSKLLIATPSPNFGGGQPSEIVEIESKTDPNKSVKLTLAELKQLVLGTVKDLTPNPPPINIKITTNKDRKGSSTTTSTSTTTPSPKPKSKTKNKKKFNPFKFTDSMLEAFAKSRDPEAYDSVSDDEFGSHWKRPQSTSFILPPYDDEGIEEHYTKSNEVMDIDGGGGEDVGEKGWLKSVFRTPTRVINNYSKSFNRWRGVKPKQKQRHRPIADITYHPRDRDQRRRNKNPPPSRSNRRPSSGGRYRGGRPGHRRRGQYERPRNRYSSSYYDDKYDTSEYSSHRRDDRHGGRYSSPSYYGEDDGDQSWDRTDHLTSRGATLFDSTMPHDDTPYNMSPPRESSY